MKPEYAELHLHTAYSLLDGASLPEEIINRAAELDYKSLAITDHNGLYGAMEFAQAARVAGIQPITGAEVTLTDSSHLTLLAETATGYRNLCRLITLSFRDGADRTQPRLSPERLPEYAEGIILLTGCRQGRIAQYIDKEQFADAAAELERYRAWFGHQNVFVELQQNLVYGDTRRNRRLVEMAKHLGVRYVATGNVHYHDRDRHQLQDTLVAIRNNGTLDSTHRERRANSQFHLKSADEMAILFASYPDALTTSLEIADRCANFDLTQNLNYAFPEHLSADGETEDDRLRRICYSALDTRYPDPEDRPAAKQRLGEELALIQKHGLGGFFLLYHDLLRLAEDVANEVRGPSPARRQSMLPPGRGRGSSVGSIVCHLIGLSHIDPLKHNLFLGRFLNEELASVPDIDLDFPRDIRERLIERVYEKYGHDHAALVSAFSTYRLRSAVRDIGKVLGLPGADIDKIAKLSEARSAKDLGEELDRIPAYASRRTVPPWKFLVDLAEQLSGFPRHVSQHSGGMVISSRPLIDMVPVQPAAMDGRFICHWDKDSCADARFIKIDFLALGMLSLVEECLELIVEAGKEPVDLSRIPFDDPAVYDRICAGDTVGIFQIESRAQIQMLTRTRPRTLDDLVVQVAIVRPGPIVGGAVNPYVSNRQQQLKNPAFQPQYDHPLLKPVLKETLGVILYQEQVMEAAMALAGFSSGQADQLRKAMSRKRSREAMLNLWKQFLEGARARDVPDVVARDVFKKLLAFAEYGFPKSHSAAFAVLSYQSAWLRYYYTAEFTCAIFNNQPMGFYPPHVLTNDAKRHGVRVLPPDINISRARCSVDGNAVRIGFGYVNGVSKGSAMGIEQERACNGPYQSLADFVRRFPIRRESAEQLILVGAFDCFGLSRREALWQLGLFIPARQHGRKGEPARQMPLQLPIEQDMVELTPMTPWEQMANDYNTLGLSPRYHPLGLLRTHLSEKIVTSVDLETLPNGSIVEIAGLVVCRQRPGTAKNITFLLLEDERGLANVIVYPNLYERDRLLVRGEPFLLVRGRLQRMQGTINVLAQTLQPLEAGRQIYEVNAAGEEQESENSAEVETGIKPRRRHVTLKPKAHNYH